MIDNPYTENWLEIGNVDFLNLSIGNRHVTQRGQQPLRLEENTACPVLFRPTF